MINTIIYYPEIQDKSEWVCYECKDGNCSNCVGVPCHCPCPIPVHQEPEYEI